MVVLQDGIRRGLHDGNSAFAGKINHEVFLHIEFGDAILPDGEKGSNPKGRRAQHGCGRSTMAQ
jgi:hypothetical protein